VIKNEKHNVNIEETMMSDVICSLNNQQKGCYLNRMVPGKKVVELS
jgi:hypothetical protein